MFFIIKKLGWHHFRSTSGFIGRSKFYFQKFLLHQKMRRKISGGVLLSIFHLWPYLVGVIADFDPYVSLLTNKSATVKGENLLWFRKSLEVIMLILIIGKILIQMVHLEQNIIHSQLSTQGIDPKASILTYYLWNKDR